MRIRNRVCIVNVVQNQRNVTNQPLLLPLLVGSQIPRRHFEYLSDVTQVGASDCASAPQLTFVSRPRPIEALPLS